MWGPRASVISEYLGKGDPILIEGHLKQENWETKDGEKRSKIIVSIEDFEFMNSKKDQDSKPVAEKAKQTKNQKEMSLQDIPF